MKEESRNKDWQSLVKEYENSKSSFSGFCKTHGFAPSTFRYHVEKYSDKKRQKKKRSNFYPLMIPTSSPAEPQKEISLDLPHGIRLTIKG